MSDEKTTPTEPAPKPKRERKPKNGAAAVPPPPPKVDDERVKHFAKQIHAAGAGEVNGSFARALAAVPADATEPELRRALALITPAEWHTAALAAFFDALDSGAKANVLALCSAMWSLGYIKGAYDGHQAATKKTDEAK